MTSYTNPVLAGFYPDPSICRVGDTFYIVNSTFEYFPGIPVHSSTDLVNWAPSGHVIDRESQIDLAQVPDSGGLFAPTLRYHEGLFYVACTLVDGVGMKSFYATATDPEGTWSDPVWVEGAEGIDPSMFFHGGKVWWTGTRPAPQPQWEQQTEIWLRELDLTTGTLIGPEYVLWTGALLGAVWSEAPHIFEREGWFYLLTAEGGTARNHSVVIARSRSVTGPYLGNPKNPVMTHRSLGQAFPVQNVGHADLVEDSTGRWWAVLLGVRTIDGHHTLGRETFLAPVEWEDEWPVFNPGVGQLSRKGTTPFTASGVSGGSSASPSQDVVDFKDFGVPDSQWLSHRGPAHFARPTELGLAITPTGLDLSRKKPAFLGRRMRHADAVVAVRIAAPESGLTAGLALIQNSQFHIRLELHAINSTVCAIAIGRRAGEETVLGQVVLPDLQDYELIAQFRGTEVVLRVGGLEDDAGGEVVVARADARILSSETAGGFVATLAGPFAVGDTSESALVVGWAYSFPTI